MHASTHLSLLVGAVVLVALYRIVGAEGFPDKSAYLIDSRGTVVRNAYGECWRTGYWTPASAIAECDPDLVMKESPKAGAPQTPPPAPVAAPPARAAAAPAPAVAPAPAPATVVAPDKPAVSVSLNAEALFDFDKAVIRPDGKKILEEKIVAGVQAHPEIALLVITGHADRIGAEEYNQKLSERRANAVKAFLERHGIPAARMKAYGKGKTMPNPEANTRQVCKGKRGAKLIACLQPDRRVTVESQGRTSDR